MPRPERDPRFVVELRHGDAVVAAFAADGGFEREAVVEDPARVEDRRVVVAVVEVGPFVVHAAQPVGEAADGGEEPRGEENEQ